jgi:hypothetical protein
MSIVNEAPDKLSFYILKYLGLNPEMLVQIKTWIKHKMLCASRAGMFSSFSRSILRFYLEKQKQVWTSRMKFDLCISAQDWDPLSSNKAEFIIKNGQGSKPGELHLLLKECISLHLMDIVQM